MREDTERRFVEMGWGMLVSFCVVSGVGLGCHHHQPAPPEPGCVPDGVCDPTFESRWTCPEDCTVRCPADLESLGPPQLWTVASLAVPRDATTAAEVGFDLDQDGRIDNQWGRGLSHLVDNYLEPGGPGDDAIARGDLALLVRTWGDLSAPGGLVEIQLLPHGRRVSGSAESPARVYGSAVPGPQTAICAEVTGDGFLAGPSLAPMETTLVLNNERPVVVELPYVRVTVRGRLDAGRLRLTVGAGLSNDGLQTQALPALVSALDVLLREDPDGEIAQEWLYLVSDCSASLPGCDPIPPSCNPDDIITLDELRCAPLVSSIMRGDLDTDGDGEVDALSIGYDATAVPATLVGSCGDGALDAALGEVCDGALLGGHTCEGEGYPLGGTLACAGCQLDRAQCLAACGDEVCQASEVPAQCAADCGPEAVFAGGDHACALLADRSVRCWGRNDAGQLGRGYVSKRVIVEVPEPSLVVDASSLAPGERHTCALRRDGQIQCWGEGALGQLGDGQGQAHLEPTPVSLDGTAIQVSARGDQSCALRWDGTVWCWGAVWQGPLVQGGALSPVAVSGLPPAVLVAVGRDHACAVGWDRRVYCWGSNVEGQLGQSSPHVLASVPALVVSGLGDAVALAAGDAHTCALLADTTVWCWGDGRRGQLGSGAYSSHTDPEPVQAVSGVVEIAAGGAHTCARFSAGVLRCWGANHQGQLGFDEMTDAATPQRVDLFDDFTSVTAGQAHTCAMRSGGHLVCWGSNEAGQLDLEPARTRARRPETPVGFP